MLIIFEICVARNGRDIEIVTCIESKHQDHIKSNSDKLVEKCQPVELQLALVLLRFWLQKSDKALQDLNHFPWFLSSLRLRIQATWFTTQQSQMMKFVEKSRLLNCEEGWAKLWNWIFRKFWSLQMWKKKCCWSWGSNPRPSHPQLTAFPFIHVNIVRKVLILATFESDIRIMSSRSE